MLDFFIIIIIIIILIKYICIESYGYNHTKDMSLIILYTIMLLYMMIAYNREYMIILFIYIYKYIIYM